MVGKRRKPPKCPGGRFGWGKINTTKVSKWTFWLFFWKFLHCVFMGVFFQNFLKNCGQFWAVGPPREGVLWFPKPGCAAPMHTAGHTHIVPRCPTPPGASDNHTMPVARPSRGTHGHTQAHTQTYAHKRTQAHTNARRPGITQPFLAGRPQAPDPARLALEAPQRSNLDFNMGDVSPPRKRDDNYLPEPETLGCKPLPVTTRPPTHHQLTTHPRPTHRPPTNHRPTTHHPPPTIHHPPPAHTPPPTTTQNHLGHSLQSVRSDRSVRSVQGPWPSATRAAAQQRPRKRDNWKLRHNAAHTEFPTLATQRRTTPMTNGERLPSLDTCNNMDIFAHVMPRLSLCLLVCLFVCPCACMCVCVCACVSS